MKLKDKAVLVTGAGTGIGRSIALACAREGARVAVNGRRPGPIEATVAAIAAEGGTAFAVQADVTQSPDVQRMMQAVVERFGRLDVLVNNAGSNPPRADLLEASEDDWKLAMDGNLTSVFLCCKYAMPHLIASKGNIVNIVSVLGYVKTRKVFAYASAKAGSIMLTKNIALDFGRKGVRCNGVAPARVETEMNAEAIRLHRERGTYDQMVKAFPLGFLGDTDDIARAVIYLASDDARWVTGAIVPVDGGIGA